MKPSLEKQKDVTYLDIQAAVGITKHIGGFRATDERIILLSGRKP